MRRSVKNVSRALMREDVSTIIAGVAIFIYGARAYSQSWVEGTLLLLAGLFLVVGGLSLHRKARHAAHSD